MAIKQELEQFNVQMNNIKLLCFNRLDNLFAENTKILDELKKARDTQDIEKKQECLQKLQQNFNEIKKFHSSLAGIKRYISSFEARITDVISKDQLDAVVKGDIQEQIAHQKEAIGYYETMVDGIEEIIRHLVSEVATPHHVDQRQTQQTQQARQTMTSSTTSSTSVSTSELSTGSSTSTVTSRSEERGLWQRIKNRVKSLFQRQQTDHDVASAAFEDADVLDRSEGAVVDAPMVGVPTAEPSRPQSGMLPRKVSKPTDQVSLALPRINEVVKPGPVSTTELEPVVSSPRVPRRPVSAPVGQQSAESSPVLSRSAAAVDESQQPVVPLSRVPRRPVSAPVGQQPPVVPSPLVSRRAVSAPIGQQAVAAPSNVVAGRTVRPMSASTSSSSSSNHSDEGLWQRVKAKVSSMWSAVKDIFRGNDDGDYHSARALLSSSSSSRDSSSSDAVAPSSPVTRRVAATPNPFASPPKASSEKSHSLSRSHEPAVNMHPPMQAKSAQGKVEEWLSKGFSLSVDKSHELDGSEIISAEQDVHWDRHEEVRRPEEVIASAKLEKSMRDRAAVAGTQDLPPPPANTRVERHVSDVVVSPSSAPTEVVVPAASARAQRAGQVNSSADPAVVVPVAASNGAQIAEQISPRDISTVVVPKASEVGEVDDADNNYGNVSVPTTVVSGAAPASPVVGSENAAEPDGRIVRSPIRVVDQGAGQLESTSPESGSPIRRWERPTGPFVSPEGSRVDSDSKDDKSSSQHSRNS